MKVDPKNHGNGGGGDGEFINPIPAGRYVLQADRFRRNIAKTGTPMLAIMFRVLGPRHAKRVIWQRFAITEAAIWRLAQFSAAANHLDPFDAESDADINRLMGKVVAGDVEVRTFGGKTDNEVQTFLPLTEDEARTHGGSAGSAAPSGGAGRVVPAADPVEPTWDDDDIPF